MCALAPTSRITFRTVEALARDLPRVERGTSWGAPALKVDGQMFACVPTHKSAEPGSIAVRLDFPDRDELIANDPRTFYVKEHYVDYPCVLVRLEHIHRDALRDLLRMAWQYVSTKKRRRSR
jgi:hypothetical protein